MPRIKLTQKAVDKLRAPDPSGKQVIHWDTEVRGFGVLCSGTTNARSFIVQRDVGGRTRRLTIEKVPRPLRPGETREDVKGMSLDEARREAEGKLADLGRGIDPKSGRGGGTLRETLAAYLEANHRLAANSRRNYRDFVERHLGAWLDLPLRAVTAEMVEQRHRAIAAEVKKGGRGGGGASANLALRTLRVLWNFAAERAPALPPNPVVRLKRQWYPQAARTRMVRAEDLPKFYRAVQALPNPIARDYLLLLLFTGLRREEAAGLRWADVDFVQRVIRLPAARTKAGRRLDLPMSDFIRDLLVARRAIGKTEFVFPSNSKAGYIAEPKFPLTQVAAATGIRISAHDLRRGYLTVAESADISPIALRALANHALGGDVTSGYIQMTVERLRDPAQRVADRMKALCGIEEPEGVERVGGQVS